MTCKKIVTLRVQKQIMRKRVKEKKKSEQRKESEKKIKRKTKKQWSFYAKASDVKNAFYTNQPIFL